MPSTHEPDIEHRDGGPSLAPLQAGDLERYRCRFTHGRTWSRLPAASINFPASAKAHGAETATRQETPSSENTVKVIGPSSATTTRALYHSGPSGTANRDRSMKPPQINKNPRSAVYGHGAATLATARAIAMAAATAPSIFSGAEGFGAVRGDGPPGCSCKRHSPPAWTRSEAGFGRLFLDRGRFGDDRLIPERWSGAVEEAAPGHFAAGVIAGLLSDRHQLDPGFTQASLIETKFQRVPKEP